MKKTTIFLCLFLAFSSYSQIEISKEKQLKEKKIRTTFESIDSSYTEVLIGANYGFTNRLLIENEGLFGDSLGQKAQEEGLNAWSFGLIMCNRFHPHFAWTGGIRYLQNGETYRFEEGDSLYAYENKYRYVSMPIRLEFFYGKRFGVSAGVGIEPQMLSGFNQALRYKDSLGVEQEENFSAKDGFSSFVLSVNATIGMYYCINRQFTVHLTPEYRRQLTSSFDKYAPYKHYGYAWGVNLMLGYKF